MWKTSLFVELYCSYKWFLNYLWDGNKAAPEDKSVNKNQHGSGYFRSSMKMATEVEQLHLQQSTSTSSRNIAALSHGGGLSSNIKENVVSSSTNFRDLCGLGRGRCVSRRISWPLAACARSRRARRRRRDGRGQQSGETNRKSSCSKRGGTEVTS